MTAALLAHSRTLLPHHAALVARSAISSDVAASRGYFTAIKASELRALGFKDYQARVPALVIPIRDVTGAVVLYQSRPDNPRKKKDKALKYETVAGARMVIDVPSIVRPSLGDPAVPLFVTEGTRKADAAVSAGLCCVSLLGVDCWRGRNGANGKTSLSCWESIALNGRDVFVAFDSDVMQKPGVQAALARLTRFLEGRDARVLHVHLPNGANGEKVGLDDFLAAGHTADDVLALAAPTAPIVRALPKLVDASNGRPGIVVSDRQLDVVLDEALAALVAANHPAELFLRGGAVVAVTRDEDGRPMVRGIGDAGLVDRLAACARWVRLGRNGSPIETGPTASLASVLLKRLESRVGSLPPLRGITESPQMRVDGSILDRRGYDAATGLYYAPAGGFEMPLVPEAPTPTQIDDARALLDEVLLDFPIGSDADYATAFAALLTVPLRELVGGCVPAILIDAPAPGTGKGLLTDTSATLATGSLVAKATEPDGRSDDEWRKRITALLIEGRPLVILDNVERPIGSAALSAALTTTVWSDRLLGHTQTVTVANRAVWFVTGNNLRLRGDLARRVVWCRLDAKIARPWTRAEFRHPDLIQWVREHRGELLAAIFTLARAWIAAGRPGPDDSTPRLGSFEGWRETIGGVLRVAGIPGFLGNLARLYDQADDETPALAAFLVAWRRRYGTDPIVVATLVTDVRARHAIAEALPPDMSVMLEKPTGAAQRIGKALLRRADTRVVVDGGTLRLIRGFDHGAQVATWSVVE